MSLQWERNVNCTALMPACLTENSCSNMTTADTGPALGRHGPSVRPVATVRGQMPWQGAKADQIVTWIGPLYLPSPLIAVTSLSSTFTWKPLFSSATPSTSPPMPAPVMRTLVGLVLSWAEATWCCCAGAAAGAA